MTIRELRKAKHWSQTKLADHAGVSYDTISRLERRQGTISRAAFRVICQALEVDPSEVIGVNLLSRERKTG